MMEQNGNRRLTVDTRSMTFSEALVEADRLLTPGRVVEAPGRRLIAAIVEHAWTHQVKPKDYVESEVFARCRRFYGGAYGYRGEGEPSGLPRTLPEIPPALAQQIADKTEDLEGCRLARVKALSALIVAREKAARAQDQYKYEQLAMVAREAELAYKFADEAEGRVRSQLTDLYIQRSRAAALAAKQ